MYAIVFGAAEPGLAGRMLDYVTPKGEVVQDSVSELIEAVGAQTEHALTVAKEAWGADVLANAGLDDDMLRSLLQKLPERIQHVMDCTARQVHDLYQSVEFFAEGLDRRPAAMRASELINRLLGKRTEGRYDTGQADDRSAGYPLRRLAEFGILPGYEFPSEPAALRLLGDKHEEDPVSVTRRFGIGQFQPEATVYARTYPQWDGNVAARWTIGSGWALRLSQGEEVRWANEGRPPSSKELEVGALMLHPKAKGYLLCPTCGRLLPPPELDGKKTGGKKNAKKGNKKDDDNGHTDVCPNRGSLARPLAISTAGSVEILRLLVPVPANSEKDQWESRRQRLSSSRCRGFPPCCQAGDRALGPSGLRNGLLPLPQVVPESALSRKLGLAANDPCLGRAGAIPAHAAFVRNGRHRRPPSLA